MEMEEKLFSNFLISTNDGNSINSKIALNNGLIVLKP